MVLKNLLTGQQWRNGHRDRLVDMGRGEERLRCMKRVTGPPGICCMAKKTQTGALQQPRGEGEGREVQKGGDICIPMADSC